VLRRTLVFLGVLAAWLAVAAPALAVRIHMRVEGVGQTIYGAREPLLTPVSGSFRTPGPGSVQVMQTGQTPFGALERASRTGEFYYHAVEFSFGPFVDRIGRYPASGSSGWVYKVNHVSPPVGANAYQLKDGDEVLWYFARFGAQGGPKTLDLVRRPAGCFRALLRDDNGNKSRASDVIFVQDGRRISSASGERCPSGRWRGLRATKAGAIRSEVVGPRSS
jgi:Domain of unknown function (DUF4430)